MNLKEKVIEVLRQPCPIMVGDKQVGLYQMDAEEADAIYARLTEAGLLIGEYMKYHVYEPVTEHYGIVMKRSLDNDVYCVFASDTKDMKAAAAVCGTLDKERAVRECRYLEAMNYGGDFRG